MVKCIITIFLKLFVKNKQNKQREQFCIKSKKQGFIKHFDKYEEFQSLERCKNLKKKCEKRLIMAY